MPGSIPGSPTKNRSIAQLGSAPGLGPGGRRFESYYSDHFVSVGELVTHRIATPLMQVRVLSLTPTLRSCSLMVKHPAYTRHSLQIRERCRFESCQDYQLFFTLGVDKTVIAVSYTHLTLPTKRIV